MTTGDGVAAMRGRDLGGPLRRHLTYANVMATIAVFGMLGGGAYAVTAVKKNSVTSKSVKDNSLTGGDVLNNSLTGADVAEASLQGVSGPQGPPGPPGPTAAGVANRSDPVVAPDSLNPTGSGSVSVPTAGRIFAVASGTVTVTCTAGNATLGLYVDGTTPIADTQISLTSGVATDFAVFGLTGTVAPGDRPITFGLDCPGGTISPAATFTNNKLGGILIGD